MELAWETVRRYVEANAKNLMSGKRMQDGSDEQVLERAEAYFSYIDHTTEELGLFAWAMVPLLQYAQRKGWTLVQIEEAIIAKLALRFGPLPAPTLSVQQAHLTRRCRLCRKSVNIRGLPALEEETVFWVTHPEIIIIDYGREFAHQRCLMNAGIPIPTPPWKKADANATASDQADPEDEFGDSHQDPDLSCS